MTHSTKAVPEKCLRTGEDSRRGSIAHKVMWATETTEVARQTYPNFWSHRQIRHTAQKPTILSLLWMVALPGALRKGTHLTPRFPAPLPAQTMTLIETLLAVDDRAAARNRSPHFSLCP